jgi:arginine/lysine/ornithine decarboxylase
MDALLITSPTYEGLTADIAAIVKVAHSYNVPVIVDEAHGAHLGFHSYFPVNALSQGADIVVQSLHKTLPSLTQTALLHIGKEAQDYVERSKVERFLGIYQTSSPSYVFMGAMAKCLHAISGEQFERFAGLLQDFYEKCSSFRHVHVYHELECEGCGQRVLGQDYSKLIIYTDNNLMNGQALFECLQDEYHLECEMAAPLYVLAMTSFCDTKEGFERLWKALGEIDIRLEEFLKDEARCNGNEKYSYDIARYVDSKNLQSKTAIADRNHCHLPEVICTIDQAIDSSKKETINLKNAAERVSAEYIYCYPPGAPIIVPGERIREEDLAYIEEYQEIGLNMQGLDDYHFQKIKVLKEPI